MSKICRNPNVNSCTFGIKTHEIRYFEPISSAEFVKQIGVIMYLYTRFSKALSNTSACTNVSAIFCTIISLHINRQKNEIIAVVPGKIFEHFPSPHNGHFETQNYQECLISNHKRTEKHLL